MREEWRRLRERGCALPVSKTQNSGTLILRKRTGMARPHLRQDLHLPVSQLAGGGNSEVLLDGPQVKGIQHSLVNIICEMCSDIFITRLNFIA